MSSSVDPHPLRSGRRALRRPGWVGARLAAVVSVIAVVAGVAVTAALTPVRAAPAASGVADGVVVAPGGAQSSSAFCAGATAGSGGAADAVITLTNSTRRPVRGAMTSVTGPDSGTATGAASGATGGTATARPVVRRAVVVPALGSTTVDPGAGLPGGPVAASFVFAGGGVAVNQIVSGPSGWSTAPCASGTSASWYFAGGSTVPGDMLSLALFNPASTDAVVNVSFVTGGGVIAPQGYQGLVVSPGRLVVEQVGSFVQDHPEIATVVSAQSGALVADELQVRSAAATTGLSLRLGSPSLSATWQFAQTTSSPGATVTFHLANPGNTPADVTIAAHLAIASVVPIQVQVPAQSVMAYNASASSRLPKQIPYAVTIDSSTAIVVGRSVQAANGATSPVWGSTAGTTTVATHWLVPAPGVAGATGVANAPVANATVDSLAISNPGPLTADVIVTALGNRQPSASVAVAPGSVIVIGSSRVGGLQAFDVRSSQPVALEEDDGPAAAPGIVVSAGVPLAG